MRRNPLMMPKRSAQFFYDPSLESEAENFHKHNWDNLDDEGGIILN